MENQTHSNKTARRWVIYAFGDYNPVTRGFTPDAAGACLRVIARTGTAALPDGIAGKSAYTVEILDAVFGRTLLRETRLYTGGESDALLTWETRAYDTPGHLLSTEYSDGTAATDVWGCCQKESSVGRDGSVTDYWEIPGVPLWSAEAEISFGALPGAGGRYPVTETVIDALGRVTNSVRAVWCNGSRDSAYAPLVTHTDYPYGTDGYSVTTDPLGVQTVTRTYYGNNAKITETASGGVTNRTTEVWGGATVIEKFWDGKWTRETRSTTYSAGGCRVEMVTAEASDIPAPVVTSETMYDFLGRAVSVTMPLGVTSNFYDGASDRVTRVSRTGLPDTLYTYNVLGDVVETVADMNGNGIPDTGDETDGNVEWYEEGDLGLFSESAYWHCAASIRGEAGRVLTNSVVRTRQTGFSAGMLAQTVDADMRGNRTVSTTAFNPATGEKTETVVYPYASNSEIRVGMFGRPVSHAPLNGSFVSYMYDGFGRQAGVVVRDQEENGLATSFTEYHPDGSVARVAQVREEGSTNSVLYTPPSPTVQGGYSLTITNALGGWRVDLFDASGNLIGQSGPSTYPLGFGYDTGNHLSELLTLRGGETPDATRWLADLTTGLVTGKVSATGSGISYGFSETGKMLTRVRQSGRETFYGYTAGGRLATVAYAGTASSHAVSNSWDGSLLVRVDDAQGTRFFAYDSFGAVCAETNAFAVVSCNRDLYGRIGHIGLGDYYGVEYSYDAAAGRPAVTDIADGATNRTFTLAYASSSDYVSDIAQQGGGFESSRVYDVSRNVLVSVSNFWNGTLVSSFTYDCDALGRRTARVDMLPGVSVPVTNSFCYNERSELTNAVMGGVVHKFGYDNIGNRTWSSEDSVTVTYSANALNQYAVVTNGGTNVSVEYDEDGNMTALGGWHYYWDGENNMVGASPVSATNGSLRVECEHDYLNRRFRKTVDTLTGYEPPSGSPPMPGNPGEWLPLRVNEFVWDQWNIVAEIVTEGGTAVTNLYYWCADVSGTRSGAGGVGGLRMASFGGTPAVYCYDGNGNVTELLHADTGEVLAHYEYNPFGKVTKAEGPLATINPWRFATRYHDGETGLAMFPRRPYSPELGRFLAQDPAGEDGGYNLYPYCGNNPVNSVDPLGLWKVRLVGSNWEGGGGRVTDAFETLKRNMPAYITRLREWMSAASKLPDDCAYKRHFQQELTRLYGILGVMEIGLNSDTELRIYSKRIGADDYGQAIFGWLYDEFRGKIYLNRQGNNSHHEWDENTMISTLFHELAHVAGAKNDEDMAGSSWFHNAHNVDDIAEMPSRFSLAKTVNDAICRKGNKCCPSRSEWEPK